MIIYSNFSMCMLSGEDSLGMEINVLPSCCPFKGLVSAWGE